MQIDTIILTSKWSDFKNMPIFKALRELKIISINAATKRAKAQSPVSQVKVK